VIAQEDRYDSLFGYYCEVHGLDAQGLKAQAIAESGLDPFARSSAGAVGLMQFMAPTWAEWFGKLHPGRPLVSRTDAERSIELGAAYMRSLLDSFGEIVRARAAYNWGMGNLRNHIQRFGGAFAFGALPDETQEYLERIDLHYARLLAGG
jgi:membrane-bound lytic murein transglycosylase D